MGDDLAELLVESIHFDDGLPLLAMLPESCQKALTAVRNEVGSVSPNAALVVEDGETRPFARKLFELEFPKLAVLSHSQFIGELEPAGTVRLEESKWRS